MNTKTLVALVAVAIIAISAHFFPGQPTRPEDQLSENVGSRGTRFPSGLAVGTADEPTYQKFTVGDDGSPVADMLFGTCNANGPTAGLIASSTGTFFCTVTGVESGDKIFVSLPRTISDGSGSAGLHHSAAGIFHNGATYATTSGKFAFELTNMSGVATTSFRYATTSVQYWIIR